VSLADLESQVLTAPEVARILRCSAGHVHELVKRGELPAMRHVGRKVLITRRAIEAFIEGRREDWQARRGAR